MRSNQIWSVDSACIECKWGWFIVFVQIIGASAMSNRFSPPLWVSKIRGTEGEQGQTLNKVLCGNLLGFVEEGYHVSVSFSDSFLRIIMREFCVNESRTVLHC